MPNDPLVRANRTILPVAPEAEAGLRRRRLGVGEAVIAAEPMILETLLGSCISVSVWNRRSQVGALCHGVYPRCPAALRNERISALHYVDFAVEWLIGEMAVRGVESKNLETKVFGGANLLSPLVGKSGETVGWQNCESALSKLDEWGILPICADVGGNFGRMVYFSTATGEVMVRRLPLSAEWVEGKQKSVERKCAR